MNIMGYGITYLSLNSASLLLLPSSLYSLPLFLSLKHQEIASVKHSFITQVPVYCENRFIYQKMKYVHALTSLRSSAPLTEKVTKFNMNINLNLIEQG